MFIKISLRTGIGFDIEYNEDICYIASEGKDDDDLGLYAYEGIIVGLPFIKLHIGQMVFIGEMKEI